MRFKYVILYTSVFTSGIVLLYWFIDYITGSGLGSIGYLIGYFKPDDTIHLSLKAPFLFSIGLVRSLFGVEILFRIPSVSDFVVSYFPGKDLSDEIFMVRDLNIGLVYFNTFLMLLVGIVLLAGIVFTIKKFPMLKENNRKDFNFILAGLAAVTLPVIVSGPILYSSTSNNEHLLLFWALFFLCSGLVFEQSGSLTKRVKIAAILVLISIFVINGFGSMHAMINPKNDLNIVTFNRTTGMVKANDLLIVHLTERDAAALSYNTGAATINTMHEDYPSINYLKKWNIEHEGTVWVQQDVAPEGVKYPLVSGFKLEKLNSQ